MIGVRKKVPTNLVNETGVSQGKQVLVVSPPSASCPTSPGRGRAVGRNILGQCFPGVFCSVVVMFRVISPGLAHMLF